MTTPESPAVEAVHLSKTFLSGGWVRKDVVQAVDDVSFRLKAGTTLALVGESGSGKTTVARMVAGLESPTEGEVRIFDEPRAARPGAKDRRAVARKVQLVFQNPYRSLDPRQTIGSAIEEFIQVHFDWDRAQREARVKDLLELVSLPHRMRTALPSELSGGQRQRACIARALAPEPRILVLDEAVAALDVSVQAHVLNVLADVRDSTGVSYLFVTHDLAVVRQIADDVIVLRMGAVVESGPAARVLDEPQEQYTRILRDSVPRDGWTPSRRA
ncbi:MAG: ATP-binding cassette domain-containing protein [Lacisediminihabitans sp.]